MFNPSARREDTLKDDYPLVRFSSNTSEPSDFILPDTDNIQLHQGTSSTRSLHPDNSFNAPGHLSSDNLPIFHSARENFSSRDFVTIPLGSNDLSNALHRENISDTIETDQSSSTDTPERDPDPLKFNSSPTYTSAALIGVYTALNISVAHTLRNNPAAALPVIYNLTGYLPQLATQAYDCYKHDEALNLDSTMYTKIIGAGVVEGVQINIEKFPKQMGVEGKNGTMVSALWSLAAATTTDLAGRFIRRLIMHKSTIYSNNEPRRDPDQYLSFWDQIAHNLADATQRSYRSIAEKLTNRQPPSSTRPSSST